MHFSVQRTQRGRGRFSLILAHRLSEGVEMIEVLLDGVHRGEGLAALVLDVGWRDGRHAAPQETLCAKGKFLAKIQNLVWLCQC
jgi:hypothetical protein